MSPDTTNDGDGDGDGSGDGGGEDGDGDGQNGEDGEGNQGISILIPLKDTLYLILFCCMQLVKNAMFSSCWDASYLNFPCWSRHTLISIFAYIINLTNMLSY